MARRRKKPPAPVQVDHDLEGRLWLMGLAKRPAMILRLELDSFPLDYRPRARA